MTTSTREACPRCKGAGSIEATSFVDPSKTVQKSCHICKGSGYLTALSDTTKAAPLPRHLVRRGMRPDGTFPPSDDDEAPDAQELVKRLHRINAGKTPVQANAAMTEASDLIEHQAAEIAALTRYAHEETERKMELTAEIAALRKDATRSASEPAQEQWKAWMEWARSEYRKATGRDQWILVPRDPTPEMIQAMEDRQIEGASYLAETSIQYALWKEVYAAMLKAVPMHGKESK